MSSCDHSRPFRAACPRAIDTTLSWVLAFDRARVDHLVDVSTGQGWKVGNDREQTLDWLAP